MMKISSEVIILVAVIVVTLVALCAAEARRIQSLNRILKAERLSHLPPAHEDESRRQRMERNDQFVKSLIDEAAEERKRVWPDPDVMHQRYRGNWWNN